MLDPDREASLRRAIEELYFGYRAFTALPDKMLAQRGLGRTHHRILYLVRRDPGVNTGGARVRGRDDARAASFARDVQYDAFVEWGIPDDGVANDSTPLDC